MLKRELFWIVAVVAVLMIAFGFVLYPKTRAKIYESKALQILGALVLTGTLGICIWRGVVYLAIIEVFQKDRLKG